ncbi:LysR family transcriptional regulator [Massilia sp. WF1]|uniref:LysR family transcriptional regulator n=1 Tax=unclassified Massilia TaxID=2609279 RepID=UPI00064B38AD|nr:MULTISPECIES: LysR family transcriptional regulator [unclassified Massilia]ALK99167.1 LysR family transcriptional regulator [Massilia sp. WG5]KLU35114.1 LysR family transcriptional regulator [Massilia sp. WF1]
MKLTLDELEIFLAIVDTGSMTAAAERMRQPVSAISRLLARLETKLNTTLMRRTTRRLDLTDDGNDFVADARAILASVQAAQDRLVERHGRLAGKLRVDAATPFMLHVVVPLMPGYRARHPGVELSLCSNEGFIDLLERRVDLAIRIGELKDSTLHGRLLGHTRIRLVASPAYLASNGVPEDVPALLRHELLGFSEPESLNQWPLRHADGRPVNIVPTLTGSSGETLRQLALQGMGIACISDFMTAADIAGGRLVEVLPHLNVETTRPINAVFYRHSAVSAKIGSMVDYLAECLRAPETAWPIVQA